MTKIYIPPVELYSEYEKMLLPFDTPTWIAIALTIVISILAILAIKLMPRLIQNAIFGDNSRFMNFIDIVLNGSQTSDITGNASRKFLITMI
jgi:hypothetical protein